MKQQIEVDADREILEMRIRFEQRLKDEQEINAKLRSDTGIMRKKFTSLQKEIEDYKEEIKKNQGEISKLNGVIRNLEKDISGLKKEIQERDETIQDKVRKRQKQAWHARTRMHAHTHTTQTHTITLYSFPHSFSVLNYFTHYLYYSHQSVPLRFLSIPHKTHEGNTAECSALNF